MDVLNDDTGNMFSLPAALVFRNGTDLDENSLLGHGMNSSGSASGSNQDMIKVFGTSGPPRHEKLGDTMRKELKWAFILHAYGFGCLFFILAFYTFFSVLNLRSFISSRPFMSTINGFLCLLGISRAGSLLIDPYNLKENMPKIIGQILWDLGFPSIISAFCLVQLAFLQLTQIRIGPESLRRKSCLSLIVTAHFILTIGMDIVVASHENLTIVKNVIQYVFLTWGVFLCCNFLYSGYKVMSMVRSIPGGLKHRDLPDPSYKGIMQLAILAPHNNLAGSVTAALLPTLCTPKIHQQDNTSLSTVGFKNDGNSRILESESIPILEEAGSSGDEKHSRSLPRGSSFQNQTRTTQKFNLKPKLSLKSTDDDVRTEDATPGNSSRPKSPKSGSPKNHSPHYSSAKTTAFDFSSKPSSGILKNTEAFVTTKSICEFKTKMTQRTSFENENFIFPNKKKFKDDESSGKTDSEIASSDVLIPNILISCPDNPDGKASESEEKSVDKMQNLNAVMNEIKNDLNEMQMVREEKLCGPETVEIHVGSDRNNEIENRGKGKGKGEKKSPEGKRENQHSSDDSQKNPCKESGGSESSDILEIAKFDETPVTPKVKGRRKTKSLSWKKKDLDNEGDENTTEECLLPQENSTDVSLRSVLNHIAYMNRGQQSNASGDNDLEKIRKSKVEWVLNITYITAMWGLMLCLSNMGKMYSPFGSPESRKILPSPPLLQSNSSNHLEHVPKTEKTTEILFSPWPWLWFQTFCRALELAMGCAMANITRQPTANYRYPRAMSIRNRDTFYSI